MYIDIKYTENDTIVIKTMCGVKSRVLGSIIGLLLLTSILQ